jgi:uncharacterized protein (TIGR02246 family)
MTNTSARDVVESYFAAARSGDSEKIAELFAPDAVLRVGDVLAEGRDAVAAFYRLHRRPVHRSSTTIESVCRSSCTTTAPTPI